MASDGGTRLPFDQRQDAPLTALGFAWPQGRRSPKAHGRLAMALARRRPRPVNLALQGGGAHGAFTWGVLDRLAEVEGLAPRAISGTSAGAVNAVVFASGWLTGGPEGARANLAELWQSIGTGARRLENTGFSPATLDAALHLLSPYQLNPLDFNPLRRLLARLVDFDRLRQDRTLGLYIAATNLRTGALRLFENADLSLQAVLASACLPSLHHAIEIDGDAYWDGGYVSNPPLLPLIEGSRARDTLLVRINVGARMEHPRSAAGIRSRVGEIVFGQPLERELALLEARSKPPLRLALTPRQHRLARHRLHVLDGGEAIAGLDPATRVLANRQILDHLRDLGRTAAASWLCRDQRA